MVTRGWDYPTRFPCQRSPNGVSLSPEYQRMGGFIRLRITDNPLLTGTSQSRDNYGQRKSLVTGQYAFRTPIRFQHEVG